MEFFILIYEILDNLINFDDLDNIITNNGINQNNVINEIQNFNLPYKEIIKKSIFNKLSIKDIDEILKLKLKGEFNTSSINELKTENPDNDLINNFIKNIPNLDQFINHMNLNKQVINEIIYKYISDKRMYTIKLEKYKNLIKEYSSIINIVSENLDINSKLTLTYLLSNLDRVASYKNNKLYSLNIFLDENNNNKNEKSIRDFYGTPLTFVENLSPIVLHLIDDGFGEEVKHGLFFNLEKEMLLRYIPHLVLIYNRLDDNFINKSDFIKNKDYILEKIKNNKIKNVDDENKILNLFYNNMIEVVNKYQDKIGGYINIDINPIQKASIETIKKIPLIYDKIDNEIKQYIDKFDFAYIHVDGNIFNFNLIGIHLIKKKIDDVLIDHTVICSQLNLFNSMGIVAQHLHNKGHILVFKIDMNFMLNEKQKKILEIIFK